MGIGSITSTNSMSGMQMVSANSADPKIKRIQNEITDTQQQMQKLSSEEELTTTEKAEEQKKLKKEISSLNAELKQQQEEFLRAQQRERMLAELREEQTPENEEDEDKIQTANPSADATEKEEASADRTQTQSLQPGTVISQSSDGTVILKEVMTPAENKQETAQTKPSDEVKAETASEEETDAADVDTDTVTESRPTAKEMQVMVSADTTMQLADRMGRLVTKTDDGIAVLKGEIKQDDYRGTNTDRKQAELEEMQKQSRQETSFQFNMLGEAMDAMKTATDTGLADKAAPAGQEKQFQVSGLSAAPDEQAVQQGFHVAIA